MVSARLETKNIGNNKKKQHVIFYVVEDHVPIPIIIDGVMFYDKIVDVKQAIAVKGGSNHIKKQILLGDVKYQNGVFMIWKLKMF